ncbi:transposase [Paenibacillus sp. TRM 82003]|nr:transposase [Paenibacillus sp. TRM 82003]MCI3919382.1 transposase [Paenibacillus sp. TRM 82003]MCI3919738.1 transposase [Paenibacillus sp. TRM 82003]MCI3920721.1 transposase [Paenibacillus sp. TRM 82003]MCI3920907.1 transposase [Paenibacillus sp. TRM 82003]
MPLPKNRIVPKDKIYFKPEFELCLHCGAKLKRSHTAWKKNISTLQGVIQAWSMAYVCSNANCNYQDIYYKSAEADSLAMKHTSYGFDVLALVGQLRFKHHMTIAEITEELTGRGVATSERNSQRLYERYLTLLRSSVTDHVKEELKQVVEAHGGIMISMDGVQPEKGNETLYVVREVFSGTILVAKSVKSSSAEELKELIKPVIDLKFPIIGIVSDGQQSIRLAMEDLLPDVPYQYCQYHYLKDIAKPIVDLDRKLKTGIKKSLRGIREIERKLDKSESEDSEVVRDYLAAVRSVLLEDGNPPLDLPGIRIYETAEAIQASLQTCLDKKGALATPKRIQNIQQTE